MDKLTPQHLVAQFEAQIFAKAFAPRSKTMDGEASMVLTSSFAKILARFLEQEHGS